MDDAFREFLAGELQQIASRALQGGVAHPGEQGPEIRVEGRAAPVLNFCANNYSLSATRSS